MTGIERLRAFARRMDELSVWPGGTKLLDIADQIEREHDAEVADSPYDAILPEDRDALAWVREHGGIDHVKSEWRSRVPYDRYERRRQNLLRHIAECETALGRRRERISELGHRVSDLTNENAELRRRAMPEGMEWPMCTDGSPVKLGDRVKCKSGDCTVNSVRFYENGGVTVYGEDDCNRFVVVTEPVMRDPIERVKRPAVPAADGEPLEVGQTVWDTNGDELVIGALEDGGHTVACRYVDVGDGIPTHGMWSPSDLTHRRPMLDADGAPIKKGDTVWEVGTVLAIPMTVVEVSRDTVRCEYAWTDGKVYRPCCSPDTLTHAKPEIDTWQRIEEDAGCTATKYNERRGTIFTTKQQVARDLVRRCKTLAERERGE